MLYSALLLGFLGSAHCLTMCGPLAIAFGPKKNVWFSRITQNLGRITTYAIMGALIGFIGEQINFFGVQQKLSLFTGVLIILFALSTLLKKKAAGFITSNFVMKLHKWFNPATKSGVQRYFIFGMINGLLPCGLTYLALASAITMGSTLESSLYMALFGLGTIPSLLLVGVYGKLLIDRFRNLQRILVPSLSYIVGFILIIRGLGLGIPYLSPAMEQETQEVNCCHKSKEVNE